MRIMGVSSMFHDAAVTLIDDGEIVYAGHAERYSKHKNDPFINNQLISAALEHGVPDRIVFHEKYWPKLGRQLWSRNFRALLEPSQQQWLTKFYPKLCDVPINSYWHHQTHAAAGVLTSDYRNAAVMVIDAIGEWDTASIWNWQSGKLIKMHSVRFPSSLGLFYSAVTAHVGLKPMEDEYILMGMAAYGNPVRAQELQRVMEDQFFEVKYGWMSPEHCVKMKRNLQRGIPRRMFTDADQFDLALAAQNTIEKRVTEYALHARAITGHRNLVFMGGVALNCVANSRLFDIYDDIHIMPNPGDAGSSLGAAALEYYNITGERVQWQGPYLGTNISGAYPVKKALQSLKQNQIFGIANGRAEFGPRALGNRSLCADPRGDHIKDRMNEIKRRQQFRPFAPVILEHRVHDYFEMPGNTISPYMQFVAKCKRPEEFPAIIHADGTSRVQTVNQTQHPGLFKLLTEFEKQSGCPMLVNTSLNIKGQPIVNDERDAQAFADHYGVEVHTSD